jgi:hypothetical protein
MWPWRARPDPTEQIADSRESQAVLAALLTQLDGTVVELREVTAELKAVTAERRRGSDHDAG